MGLVGVDGEGAGLPAVVRTEERRAVRGERMEERSERGTGEAN